MITPCLNQKRNVRWLRFVPPLLMWCVGSAFGSAQEQGPWRTPPSTMQLDFTSPDLPATKTFQEQGLAIEVPGTFVMYRRDRVTIEAKLPEPGEFVVEQTNPLAVVEVRPLQGSKLQERVEIVLKVKPLSLKALQGDAEKHAKKVLEEHRKTASEEAKKSKPPMLRQFLVANRIAPPKDEQRLREVYVDVRSAELGKDAILADLKRLAQKRESWFTKSEIENWETAIPRELMKTYGTLLTCDLADEYLRELGLETTATRTTRPQVLATKVQGVHQLLTGNGGNSEQGSSESRPASLLATEVSRLGKSLTVTLKCRFFPAVDPRDPNARWFNGQRVTCSARYVAAIRVEGTLEPASGDRVDWWLLNEFSPNAVALDFPETAGIRHDMFPNDAGPVRLRVATSSEKPIAYAFELRPRVPGRGSQRVLIHESPAMIDVHFPY